MDLLKRENWWIWLIIYLFGQGIGVYVLAALLKAYEKDAWYTKWQCWVIATVCCIFPVLIMFMVFSIQVTVATARKLEVPGKEIYGAAYIWILAIIIPIIGWIFLGVMQLYLQISILIALYHGNAEKYMN